MRNDGKRVKTLIGRATTNWLMITKTYKELLKFGYNKTFTAYLKDLKAREVWIKINK